MLVAVMLIGSQAACFTLESSARRLATTNRSCVSIHVAKLLDQSRWYGRPCNTFFV